MPTYSAPIPGLVTVDHWIDAPLDHTQPEGDTFRVYAREVRTPNPKSSELPWLLFHQGGPGGQSPRPITRSGWIEEAVKDYRVLLLDQRGTGRSTPVTDRTPSRFSTAAELADYLALLRADSIVRDAELFRASVAGGDKWTTLGQSYGGWCTFTYLSFAPEGLTKCLITGGIPGVRATPDDVYRRTWPRVIAKNAEYRRRFPMDQAVLKELRAAISARPPDDPICLPGGDPFTIDRLRALGAGFGFSTGYAELHYQLERAFDGDEVATAFLEVVEHETSHRSAPLYAILQEAIYCSGPGVSSRWAAARLRTEFAEAAPDAPEVLLTGEMKEPWIFAEEEAMKPFAAAMELLNAKDDWPPLFDLDQLAVNEIPVAAAVYFDDMYVDAALSLQTAAGTPHVRTWVTNEFEHDGLRAEQRVFRHLDDLASGLA
jgi:pimeloyl-ACP methyl ester carboxylesterase